MTRAPLSLQLLFQRPALSPGEVLHTHALARIRGEERPGPAPRLSAVLVIDVSSSMSGDPLAQVIQSAHRLVELLSPEDALGLVVFSDNARQLAPLQPLSPEARQVLGPVIAGLRAHGNTNLSGGMSLGALSFPARAPGERQLALVMSDGQPNVGSSSREALAREAAVIKSRGISISTLGFGASHQEEILIAISDAGGGRYSFINDPKLSEAGFARALGAQRDIIAEDVRLSLLPGEGVEIVKVFGDPKTSFGADGLRVSLPDIIVGDELNLVVELAVHAPQRQEPWVPLSASLHGRLSDGAAFSTRAETSLTVSPGASMVPDREVEAHAAIERAAELRDQARKRADTRDFTGAKQLLAQAKGLIEAIPEFSDHPKLSDAWETLLDDLSAMDKNLSQPEYENYKRAQRSHLDFAAGGAKLRHGTGTQVGSPAALEMLSRLHQGDLPAAYVEVQSQHPGQVQRVALHRAEFEFGRVRGSDLVLPSGSVSKRHTRIVFTGGSFWLVDLGSTNGTFLNGQRVTGSHALHDGAVFSIGDFQITFRLGALPPA